MFLPCIRDPLSRSPKGFPKTVVPRSMLCRWRGIPNGLICFCKSQMDCGNHPVDPIGGFEHHVKRWGGPPSLYCFMGPTVGCPILCNMV